MSNLIPPSEELLREAMNIGLVKVQENQYTHSDAFVDIIHDIRNHPPGFIEQTKLAHRLNDEIIPFLLNYGVRIMKQGENSQNKIVVGNIATAFYGLERFFKKFNKVLDKTKMPNYIYVIYYLNIKSVPVEGN